MVEISHGDGAGTYLGAGDAKRGVDTTDGVGSHTNMSIGFRDVQSVETDAGTTENARKKVRTQQSKSKPPNSPTGSVRDRAKQLNKFEMY